MRKVTEDFIGTCQACFGEFKVNEASKLIVLHGYRRPGDGYIIGNCLGTDHAPFEYDTALTVLVIASHRDLASSAQRRADRLNAGEIVKLTRHWQEYDRLTFRTVDKSEVIEPGNKHWSATLRNEIANAETKVTYHSRVAAFLQAKVDAWTRQPIVGIDVPATGNSRTLRPAYDPAEADAAEARAAEKVKRDAKPGKLKVLFYQPTEPRDPAGYSGNDAGWRQWYNRKEAREAAFLAECRTYAKANIDGKAIVRSVSDYDLPRAIRDTGSYDVVAIHYPWTYLDEITHMFSSASPYETAPKNRSFTVAGPPRPH